MKNKTVQARITDEEFKILQGNCEKAGMGQSDYLRSCISGVEVRSMENKREIMNEVCKMFSILNQMGDTPETAKLIEGVNHICRYLK